VFWLVILILCPEIVVIWFSYGYVSGIQCFWFGFTNLNYGHKMKTIPKELDGRDKTKSKSCIKCGRKCSIKSKRRAEDKFGDGVAQYVKLSQSWANKKGLPKFRQSLEL